MRERCEAGSDLRLIDVVYHSTLGLRVRKKKITTSTVSPQPVRRVAAGREKRREYLLNL